MFRVPENVAFNFLLWRYHCVNMSRDFERQRDRAPQYKVAHLPATIEHHF